MRRALYGSMEFREKGFCVFENSLYSGRVERNEPMLKRYYATGLVICLLALLSLAACGSEKNASVPRVERDEGLIQYYNQMREIGLAGKVDEFVAMRDSVTNAEVATYYAGRGWELDSARVSDWAFNWPEVNDLPLIQDSIHGEWRRMVFEKCGIFDKAGMEKCMYPIIMWRKDGNQWKVSNATRMAAPRYKSDGSLLTMDQLNFHLMFSLPPSYAHLKPPPETTADSSRPALPRHDSIPVPEKLKGKIR